MRALPDERALILEYDLATACGVERRLADDGYVVSSTRDTDAALELLEACAFQVAVLAVELPGGSGYDVVARLREQTTRAAVVMLAPDESVAERIAGLEHGADDCLVKPFSLAELSARLRAITRRRRPEPTRFRLGALEVDAIRRTAIAGGARLELTPTEFALLATLLSAKGAGVSRTELLREVWGYRFDPGTNLVDVHVSRLRRKLEGLGLRDSIRTLRGLGYAAG